MLPRYVSRNNVTALNSTHSIVSARGSQTQTRCIPFKRYELFVSEEDDQAPQCVLRGKVLGCSVFKSRGLISADFDCARAVNYSSAVAIIFEERWRRIIETIETGTIIDSRYTRELLAVCLVKTVDDSCDACRARLLKQVRVDVRLSESEALPMIKSCANTSLEVLYTYFAKSVGSYFDYNTLTPSYVLKRSPTGASPLFRSPHCTPEHYCETFETAVRMLKSTTLQCGAQRERKTHNIDTVIGVSWRAGLGSIIHVGAHDLVVAAGLNASFLRWRSVPFGWTGTDCKAGDFTCYYEYPRDFCGIDVGFESFTRPSHDVLETLGINSSRACMRNGNNENSNEYRTVSNSIHCDVGNPISQFVERVLQGSVCRNGKCEQAKLALTSPNLQKQFARAASVDVFQSHLNADVRLSIQSAKETMSLPHPIFSVHVRRGDKYKEMKLLDLPEYLSKALPIMLTFGVKNAFLSTEDPDVVATAESKFSSINWFVTPDERKNPDLKQFRAGNLTEEFYLAMRNLHLASSCDFFVGARASNWCRLIDETQRSSGLGGTYYIDAHGHEEDSVAYTKW